MNWRAFTFILALCLLSSLSTHATILSPSATGANSQTYLQNYQTIINNSLQPRFNTTITYSSGSISYLTAPEFTSATVCAMNTSSLSNLSYYGTNTPNASVYEVRSDAFSEVGIALAMSNQTTAFDNWVNFLESMDICGYGNLPCWVVLRNTTTIQLAGNQNDTAIDGDVRVGIALFLAANSSNDTNQANKTRYFNLAVNISRDVHQYDTIAITTKATRAGVNVTRLPMGGGDCAAAGLGCSTDMWIGYGGDIIKFFQYACLFTGNQTYCADAANFTAAFYSVSIQNDTDGDGFGVAPFNFNWNTASTLLGHSGGGGVNTFYYNTATNPQWDDSDAPRFENFCDILRVQNMTTGSITGPYINASAYCAQWSRTNTYNATVTSLQYYYNGTCAANCNQTGYYNGGLGVYLSTYHNTTYVSAKVNETLTHYSWGGMTFDSTSCGTGLSFRGVKMSKALASSIGLDERWYPLTPPTTSTINLTINITDLVNGSTISRFCILATGNGTSYTACNTTGTTVTLTLNQSIYNLTAHNISPSYFNNISPVHNDTLGNIKGIYANSSVFAFTESAHQFCIDTYGSTSQMVGNTINSTLQSSAFQYIPPWTIVSGGTIYTFASINCSQSTYFNATLRNYNASATTTVTLNSSQALLEMSAEAIFVNTTIPSSSVNFTNGLYANNSGSGAKILPARVGSNNVQARASGFFNKNGTCEVTAPLQTVACSVTELYNDVYTFNATDIWNLIDIQNFSVTLTATILQGITIPFQYANLSLRQNTTNGTISFNVLRSDSTYIFLQEYNYRFSSEGYENQNATLAANASNQSHTFEVLPAPSIDITIRDADTSNLITENITISLTSNATGETFYTTSGGYFAINLTSGEYTLKLSGANYSQSTYIVTLTPGNVYFLTAYLQNTGTNEVVMQFVDSISSSVIISNALITQQALVNGTWASISTKLTDVTGRTTFNYLDDTAYRFIAAANGYQTKTFTLDPIDYSSYTIQMQRTTTLDFDQDFQSIYLAYTPTLFYNDQQNQINLTFNSPLGTFTTYSYNISYPGGTISGSGSNAVGETFSVNFNITGASYTDHVNITLTYDTSIGPARSYNYSNGIILAPDPQTFIANQDNTYGLGLLERLLIGTLIIIVAAGLVTMGAGPLWGILLALFIMGVWLQIGFWPWWAAGISFLIGFAIIAGRSD